MIALSTALLCSFLPNASIGDEFETGAGDSQADQGFSGLFDRSPFAGQGGSSASATFYTGEVDRGQIHLPIKNDFSGNFTDAIADPSLSSASFYGWQGDVKIATADLGIDPCFDFCIPMENPSLVFQWNWGKSSFQTNAFDIQTSATNANNSLLLDPQGVNGGFGNTGYIPIQNYQYFGDHQNVWASSNYEEQLYSFGLEKVCFGDERLMIETMLAFIFGQTREENVISGQTGILGGLGGTPSIDYRYENELETDRFGLQLGLSARYDLGEIAGRSVGVFAGGEARYIYNDAEAKSSASVRGLLNYDSYNNNIEAEWSDFGLVGSAGLEFEICDDATFTAGVQVESWSIGDLGTPVAQSFEIREDDRVTVTAGFGVRFDF